MRPVWYEYVRKARARPVATARLHPHRARREPSSAQRSTSAKATGVADHSKASRVTSNSHGVNPAITPVTTPIDLRRSAATDQRDHEHAASPRHARAHGRPPYSARHVEHPAVRRQCRTPVIAERLEEERESAPYSSRPFAAIVDAFRSTDASSR